MFLGTDELKQMTQVSKRPLQEAWLKKNRIPYTVGHKGRLNVLRAYVERAHGLKDVKVPEPCDEPNMDAWKQPTEYSETRGKVQEAKAAAKARR